MVEPNPVPAAVCREHGIRVIEDFLENLPPDPRAAVASSIESIEHVFSPRTYLAHLADLLQPGGLLVLTTPNVQGFDLFLLRDVSDNMVAPNHINYFNPESLRLLLESCGFDLLETLTPGQLDVELVRNKVLAGEFSLDTQPFLKRIVVDEYETYGDSFQEWLATNGLSSHLWVVARKRKG